MIRTTAVLCLSWSRSGQLTRLSSPWTSRANFLGLAAKPCFFCCCAFLAPPLVAEPRLLPIVSSPDSIRLSRAGGTRTPDLRFWRPLLYQLSYCPLLNVLASLPVRRVLPAPRAELPQLDAIRGIAPVFTRVVVTALALLTCQRYQLSHSYPPNHRGETPSRPRRSSVSCYSMIWVTTPAPTVRPPSRMAKLRPSSMAMGEINSTSITVLSPGITISTPSSRRISPVTSVVRK